MSSPLSKALGRGSAKEGSGHWIAQRITAIALIIITTWLISAIFMTPAMNYHNASSEQIRQFALDWFATFCPALLTIFFLIAMFWHGALGAQTIIEDYIHNEWVKITALVIIKLSCFAAAITGTFAVLSIYFWG